MSKKNGFTLIEVLAIIIILGVIAVITVPIILNVIDKMHMRSAIDSAYGYKDSINKYYVSNFNTDNEIDLNKRFTINNGKLDDLDIEFNGVKPVNGNLLYENNDLVSGCLTISGYKVSYDNGEFTAIKGDCNEQSSGPCINITYDVDMEACKGMLTGGGASEEEATNFCNGTGTFMGYTRDNIFIGSTGVSVGNDFDLDTINSYVSDGFISNVKYEKTCDSCFIYADGPVEVESFNLNCAGYLNYGGITDPDTIDGFCNNGAKFSGITYDDLYSSLEQELGSMPKALVDQYVSMGILSDVVYSDSNIVEVKKFLCYEDNPYGLPEYTSISDFNIPNKIGGKNVAIIGSGVFKNLGLSGVLDLQDNTNLESIGYDAFQGNNLTGVSLPDSVTSIGHYAFEDNQLTSVIIPNSVTEIGQQAFENNQLTSVSLPDSVTYMGNNAFDFKNLTSMRWSGGIPTIPNDIFRDSNLTNIIIPEGVTSIGSHAFENCNLSNVELPSSISYIHDYAFKNNNLSGNVILGNIKRVGYQAFQNNNLESVVILDGLTDIESYAFQNNNIQTLSLPNSLVNIKDYAFQNNNISEVDIPNNVEYIGFSAFNNNNISSLNLGNHITNIDSWAFCGNQLTSLSIPNSVTNIGPGAFNNNKLHESDAYIYARKSDGGIDDSILVSYGGLEADVVIPNTVTTIGQLALANNNLTSITIPNSVTSVGYNYYIKSSDSSPNLMYIFNDSDISLVSKNGRYYKYGVITSKYGDIIVLPTSSKYCLYSDADYSPESWFEYDDNPLLVDGGSITGFSDEWDGTTSINIPCMINGVVITGISSSAFSNKNLVNVTIPYGVTSIGYYAFEDNQLTSVIIPNSVTSIGSGAFRSNPNLTINVKGFTSKPSGWNANWNSSSYPVNWDYQG